MVSKRTSGLWLAEHGYLKCSPEALGVFTAGGLWMSLGPVSYLAVLVVELESIFPEAGTGGPFYSIKLHGPEKRPRVELQVYLSPELDIVELEAISPMQQFLLQNRKLAPLPALRWEKKMSPGVPCR